MKPFTLSKLLYCNAKCAKVPGRPFRPPRPLLHMTAVFSSKTPMREASGLSATTSPRARRPITATAMWVNRVDLRRGGKARHSRVAGGGGGTGGGGGGPAGDGAGRTGRCGLGGRQIDEGPEMVPAGRPQQLMDLAERRLPSRRAAPGRPEADRSSGPVAGAAPDPAAAARPAPRRRSDRCSRSAGRRRRCRAPSERAAAARSCPAESPGGPDALAARRPEPDADHAAALERGEDRVGAGEAQVGRRLHIGHGECRFGDILAPADCGDRPLDQRDAALP